MKYLSVCSGIEAATVAWEPLGWKPVGFSEIDQFPSKVLAHHYPEVPNLGDMHGYQDWPKTEVDVLVGGTPCQSFSIAGLRGGLADERGNLSLVYLRIAQCYQPEWLVWENVPGVLSSGGGRDFGSFLGALAELGYGFAYRVLNAQNFGVPQRRRRVFVVGHLGDWRRAAEVLFEPESLFGNPETSREAEQNATGTVAPCLEANDGPKWGSNQWVDNGKAIVTQKYANPLTRRMHKGINSTVDEGHTPIVMHNRQDPDVSEVCPPLGAKDNGMCVSVSENQRAELVESDVTQALSAGGGKPGQGYPAIRKGLAVRRLTPLECERLQGFPDGYTDVLSDTQRYKALGNSMAVPCMAWIGNRIKERTL